MCPFNSRRFLVAFFIAISVFGAYGQSHFTFTANTGDNMTVLVQAAINPVIDGSAIANGDEIGVFTPAGLCVGAVAWNGVNTALAVWGDNDQTVPIDGCVAGELLSYKVWDASAAKEAPVTVAYASGVPDYSVDGMAVLASLSATTPPSTPILNSPTDAAANQLTSLTLSWNTATGAATYHVQVSTSNIFASILLEDSTLVTTSRAVTGLSNNTVYYWRVRAKNAGGVSAWASAWSFTTIIAAPAVPLLALPTDATTGQTLSPTLSWNTATGAATYHVQVSTSNIFASILLEDSTLVTTSRAVTGLSNNTVYYWRVRAKNAGGVSAWASAWSFTTIIAAPAVPLLALPTDATTGQSLSPTLAWTTASGAAPYHVQVSTSNIFASILVEDSTLVTTSRAVTGLSNSAVYYRRVRAKNAGGVSAWASAWSFTTIIAAPAVPLLTLPANGATGQSASPTLSWNTVTGAATYHVQVSTSNTFASILLEDSTLTATSKTITGLDNNLTHYWRVRAKNAGNVSAWASPWSFATAKIGLFPVSAGWNMISLNIHPQDSSAGALLGPLHGIVLSKNNLGQIYWPAYGINTIGNLATGQGYTLYTDSVDTIRTLGPGIDAVSTPLALAAGWNMIGYLPENDMPVATALSAIVAQTTIVKNSRGDIYWPDYSISTIGNMKVGQGYKIHMKSSATLTYPALGKSLVGAHELLAPPEAVHYLLKLNTGNTASVLSNMVIVNGTIAPDNSEIGAFDEKGVLVGAGGVIHGITVFSVWGDNAQTPKKDGCIAAEKIMFRLWDGAQEYPATFEGPTAVSYQEDGLFIGRLTVPEALSITKFALEDAYPNPFGGQVQILFDVPALGGLDRQNIDVAVYDVRGRLVHQVAKGRYQASRYRTYWKGQDDKGAALGCGIYIIRMKARNFSKNLKLVRLK